MSRAGQIRFLSRVARLYEPVVRVMRFPQAWVRVARAAAPGAGERVLDVCTGTGGAARALAERGARVVGVDLSHGMLRRAVPHEAGAKDLAFVRADARALPFAAASFPVVTCCMALHEMSEAEREAVLREIARVCRDRVVICDYRVPRSRAGRLWFRLVRLYEYLESDAFEPFVRVDFEGRLARAGLGVEASEEAGAYRIWCCRLEDRGTVAAASAATV